MAGFGSFRFSGLCVDLCEKSECAKMVRTEFSYGNPVRHFIFLFSVSHL